MEGFEDSRRLPAAWECDETNLSSLSETSEQVDQVLEITEEELIQVLVACLLPCLIRELLFPVHSAIHLSSSNGPVE